MAESTGPILAIGAVTLINQTVLNNQSFDVRVVLATGTAAVGFAFLENIVGKPVVTLAWVALISTLFVRINPRIPSPIESARTVWENRK